MRFWFPIILDLHSKNNPEIIKTNIKRILKSHLDYASKGFIEEIRQSCGRVATDLGTQIDGRHLELEIRQQKNVAPEEKICPIC